MTVYARVQSGDADAPNDTTRHPHPADAAHGAPQGDDGDEAILFEAPEGALPTHDSTTTLSPHDTAQPPPLVKTLSQPRDGVFANMAAKPEVQRGATVPPTYAEAMVDEEIPTYAEVVSAPASVLERIRRGSAANMLLGTGAVAVAVEEGEVLVEGLPVGNWFVFFSNLVVAVAFDLLGWFLCILMASSHAARAGARSGLAVLLIRLGLVLQARVRTALADWNELMPDQPSSSQPLPSQPPLDSTIPPDGQQQPLFDNFSDGLMTPEDVSRAAHMNLAVSYIAIALGVFLLIKSNVEYIRMRRIEQIVRMQPNAQSVLNA